jgi:hypothetical protein
MKNISAGHVLGFLIIGAAQLLGYLQTNPALATELHLTTSGMSIAGALILAACEAMWGTPKPPTPGTPPGQGGFAMLRMLVVLSVVAVVTMVAAALLLGCTKAQAQTAVNAVFTVEQTACVAANAGLAGTSTAVQDFEAICKIDSSLETAVQQVVGSLATANAAKAAKASH